jgi:hypothetical protein
LSASGWQIGQREAFGQSYFLLSSVWPLVDGIYPALFPESVVALTKGIIRDMATSKLQWVCVGLAVVAVTGLWGAKNLHSQPIPAPIPAAEPAYVPMVVATAPAKFFPVFDGKAIRLELKSAKEILVDPEVKMIGTRTFIVGERVSASAGGKLWIPVEDVISIGEFKDLQHLKQYWKVEH